ncbi:MAG TPA: hypothetical protein VFL75_06390 [Candidatus Limnocylindria bacterium]|jgi:hypothetical protein|nr:hypothetical protein [Candidatus Limnocylindria bacterium]
MANDDTNAADELEALRRSRQSRVDQMLNEEMISKAPGNAAYFIGVITVCFVANLLILVLIAR